MPIISGGSGGSVTPSTLAGFEIGYDQITGDVAVSSSTEAAGTTIISAAAHTFDGSPVLATFFAALCQLGAEVNLNVFVCLFEGATEIGKLCYAQNPTATGTFSCPMMGTLRFTPTAASHTYTVTGVKGGAANPVIKCGAGGTGAFVPAFIRFTKV